MTCRLVPALLMLLVVGCHSQLPDRGATVDLVVIAPHPDDEVVMAAGVIDRAVQEHKRVAVIVVTNGDYTCERNGWVRQAETVASLGFLGVKEDDIHFLGYPDGALSRLGKSPLEPMERATPDGRCEMASGTYANRGAGRRDEHSLRTGHPAQWTSEALTEDLAALLGRFKPKDVYITHAIDAHPDHAATYVYFRRALERLDTAPAVVHRAVVHAGRCWPGDCKTNLSLESGMPPLPSPHEGYQASERLPVDAVKKFDAIRRFPSQTGPSPETDWLAGFARREEVFFPERFTRFDGRWVRAPVQERFDVPLDAAVTLDVNVDQHYAATERAGRLVLERLTADGVRQLDAWPVADEGPFVLEVEPRPDDGDVTEWSVRGPEGLVGLEVLSPRVSRIASSGGKAPR